MLTFVRARLHRDDGLTLVELLVVMTIMTVIGTIVTATVINAFGGSRRAQERVYATTDLQKGMERITRELRAAHGFRAQGVSFDAVEVAEVGRVQVNVLRGDTEPTRVRFTYYVEGGNLRETREVFDSLTSTDRTTITDSAQAPFIARVTNTDVFTYYDRNGDLLSAPVSDVTRITRIGIRMVRDLPEQSAITVETQANLRNTRE